MASDDNFVSSYLQEPFDDPDDRQVYEAAQEYIRRIDDYERMYPGPGYRPLISKFARGLVGHIASVRHVNLHKLRRRIQELQR